MLERIKEICLGNPQKEVCGLVILDRSRQSVGVIPVPNVATGGRELAEFEMHHTTWALAQKFCRYGRNDRYVLYYRFHSHPFSPAFPSLKDLESALYPHREIIYSVLYNQFFCYTVRGVHTSDALDPGGLDSPEFLGIPVQGDKDIVHCRLNEFPQDNMYDSLTDNIEVQTYESFSDWSRRHRELLSQNPEEPAERGAVQG